MRNKRSTRLFLYGWLVVSDIVASCLAFPAALALLGSPMDFENSVTLASLLTWIFVGHLLVRQVYSIEGLRRPLKNLLITLRSLAYAVGTVALVHFLIGWGGGVMPLLLGSVLAFVFVSLGRWVFIRVPLRLLRDSFYSELLIIDGVETNISDVRYSIDAAQEGIELDLNNPQMLDRLGRLVRSFDRVVVSCPDDRRPAWTLVLRGANIQGEFFLPPSVDGMVSHIGRFHGRGTQIVSFGPLSTLNRAYKRALDLAVTVPTIIVLAPLLALIAIAIKLDSPGPVLFKQERVGRSNCRFLIFKFRSMRVDKLDADGNRSASRDDDRITRVGRFLRKTSLDELPQLFNVLNSDMSLVGPRPHALGSLAGDQLFWQVDQRYWLRHSLKPGMTGLAQVRGFRGATENKSDLTDRLAADLEYVDNWTLSREIAILLQTFVVVVHRNAF